MDSGKPGNPLTISLLGMLVSKVMHDGDLSQKNLTRLWKPAIPTYYYDSHHDKHLPYQVVDIELNICHDEGRVHVNLDIDLEPILLSPEDEKGLTANIIQGQW